jgi:hypothetical protein
MSPGAPAGSWVAQRDPVRLGDAAGLDGSQSLAQTLASLPQELQRVGGGALRGGALQACPALGHAGGSNVTPGRPGLAAETTPAYVIVGTRPDALYFEYGDYRIEEGGAYLDEGGDWDDG